MGVLDALLLREEFKPEAHPRDWHGRFRVGDMVRLKVKAADGDPVIGRIQRFTDDGKKAIIAPVRGGPHVEATPSDVAFHTPQEVAKEIKRRAEAHAQQLGSSGVTVPSGVDDPNFARRRAARERQVAGAERLGLARRDDARAAQIRAAGRLREFKTGDAVHVASELRYIGRGTLTGQEKDTGHWLVTLSDGRRGRVAKDQVFRTQKEARAFAQVPHSAGWSDVAKLSAVKRPPVQEAAGISVLLEGFAPPETPAQSMAIGDRQQSQAAADLQRGWTAAKHPRGPGGRFGYTTGGKRATRGSRSSSRTLGVGSSGSLVQSIQRQLGVPADGRYGPQTRAAVTRFQQQHGLQVDGVVGRQTLAALRGSTNPRLVSPGPISSRAATVRAHPAVRASRAPKAKAKARVPASFGGGVLV